MGLAAVACTSLVLAWAARSACKPELVARVHAARKPLWTSLQFSASRLSLVFPGYAAGVSQVQA